MYLKGSYILKDGTTNLKVGGSMHWKVGVNTIKTLKFEKVGYIIHDH